MVSCNMVFLASSLKCKTCDRCDHTNELEETCKTGLTHCYNYTYSKASTGYSGIKRSCLNPPTGVKVGCHKATVGKGDNQFETTICYCKTDNCNVVWDSLTNILEMLKKMNCNLERFISNLIRPARSHQYSATVADQPKATREAAILTRENY